MVPVIGKILEIGDVREVGKSAFKIQQVVVNISTGGNVNPIPFDCKGGDIDVLSKCKVGDMVSVNYNLSGRSWQGKYYVNIVVQNLSIIAKIPEAPIPSNKEISDEDIMGFPEINIPKQLSPELDDLPF